VDNLYADLILTNGNIITMDEKKIADSLVVKNDTIQYVGNKQKAQDWAGANTEIINLQGKTILPGLIESHMHPTHYALNLLEIDCRSTSTPSIKKILEKIKDAVKNTPKGEWIRGWGWDDSKLTEQRNPTLQELDQVAPEHPVLLKRTCKHMSVVNTKAMELSGITNETKDPEGGHIERSSHSGELTGLLQETAQGLLALPDYSLEDMVDGMKLAQKDFVKWGITTIHDMSMQKEDLQTYQYLLERNDLKVRFRPWIWARTQNGYTGLLDEVLSLGIRSDFGNDMLKIQGTKFMLDGSVGGRTAAVSEPYENSESTGILYNNVSDIFPLMKKSIEGGLRVAVHGIGERSIDVAIQSFEQVNKLKNIKFMRNRIEHCALPTKNHLQKMNHLGLIAAASIGFIYHIGDSYLNNLGKERMKRVYPLKTFKSYGIVAPGNSDSPVTDGNPWTGIYGAVLRKSVSGKVLDDEQNITVYDAIKAYTKDAAYSSFEEETIGVIKPGAKADIIVVSKNPFQIEKEELKNIEVESTYINGKLVYKK